jgi:hypothetical protein
MAFACNKFQGGLLTTPFVPAQAGTQSRIFSALHVLDPRLRGDERRLLRYPAKRPHHTLSLLNVGETPLP